jgi:hypothetical protein
MANKQILLKRMSRGQEKEDRTQAWVQKRVIRGNKFLLKKHTTHESRDVMTPRKYAEFDRFMYHRHKRRLNARHIPKKQLHNIVRHTLRNEIDEEKLTVFSARIQRQRSRRRPAFHYYPLPYCLRTPSWVTKYVQDIYKKPFPLESMHEIQQLYTDNHFERFLMLSDVLLFELACIVDDYLLLPEHIFFTPIVQ